MRRKYSIKQKRAAILSLEEVGKGVIMKKAGYGTSAIRTPKRIMQSTGYKLAMSEVHAQLGNINNAIVNHIDAMVKNKEHEKLGLKDSVQVANQLLAMTERVGKMLQVDKRKDTPVFTIDVEAEDVA